MKTVVKGLCPERVTLTQAGNPYSGSRGRW